jgi:hypothetical protein
MFASVATGPLSAQIAAAGTIANLSYSEANLPTLARYNVLQVLLDLIFASNDALQSTGERQSSRSFFFFLRLFCMLATALTPATVVNAIANMSRDANNAELIRSSGALLAFVNLLQSPDPALQVHKLLYEISLSLSLPLSVRAGSSCDNAGTAGVAPDRAVGTAGGTLSALYSVLLAGSALPQRAEGPARLRLRLFSCRYSDHAAGGAVPGGAP